MDKYFLAVERNGDATVGIAVDEWHLRIDPLNLNLLQKIIGSLSEGHAMQIAYMMMQESCPIWDR